MATVKAFIVAAGCGLALLGAVSAHAAKGWNGVGINGVGINGVGINGIGVNGISLNGYGFNGLNATQLKSGPTTEGQNESLPWHSLSQRGLGKQNP